MDYVSKEPRCGLVRDMGPRVKDLASHIVRQNGAYGSQQCRYTLIWSRDCAILCKHYTNHHLGVNLLSSMLWDAPFSGPARKEKKNDAG